MYFYHKYISNPPLRKVEPNCILIFSTILCLPVATLSVATLSVATLSVATLFAQLFLHLWTSKTPLFQRGKLKTVEPNLFVKC